MEITKLCYYFFSVFAPKTTNLHQLIQWGFVIHGIIDGHSRYIVSLNAAPDNTARTAFQFFEAATQRYGFPHRMRGDHGGENVRIAEVLNNINNNPNAYIFGRSVHNQR